MLRRLKVRPRLLTVIAVPLLLLLVVAAPQVAQRWQRAMAADDPAALSRAARDAWRWSRRSDVRRMPEPTGGWAHR